MSEHQLSPSTYTVKVHYPMKDSRLVLRTDLDWNRNLEAENISSDGTMWTFRFVSTEPFHYFKPCLIQGDRFMWSTGSNYLTTSAEGVRELYPVFFSSVEGQITDIMTIDSAELGSKQQIRVYLPPGYQENTLKRYPVLYMHDGTNLFFPQESFLGVDWGVETTADLLNSMNVINKVIVVGIYAQDRMKEYTLPGYGPYGRFLVNELKPWIDARARTLKGPQETGIMGSSLGGVVSFYLGWQYPEVFGMAGCLSSTFGYNDDLFDRVKNEAKRAVRFYLDSGYPGDNFEVTRAMRDLMLKQGYTLGTDLFTLVYPGDLHNEKYWATRLHVPFQFFFSRTPRFTVNPAAS